MELSEEENKVIEDSKELMNDLAKHKDKDFIGRLYYKNRPIEDTLMLLLNIIEKLQEKIKNYRKFKKDIVDRVMIWDKEGLPKDEVVIRMIDTLMDEVSRLEDIEDKKIETEIGFIEEKRDKFWKDKIREKLNYFENSFDYDDDGTSYELVMKVLEELLEENK